MCVVVSQISTYPQKYHYIISVVMDIHGIFFHYVTFTIYDYIKTLLILTILA